MLPFHTPNYWSWRLNEDSAHEYSFGVRSSPFFSSFLCCLPFGKLVGNCVSFPAPCKMILELHCCLPNFLKTLMEVLSKNKAYSTVLILVRMVCGKIRSRISQFCQTENQNPWLDLAVYRSIEGRAYNLLDNIFIRAILEFTNGRQKLHYLFGIFFRS